MLFALLFGTAFHFLDDNEDCRAGIDFCAKTLLRAGVALLGFRITFDEMAGIGALPLLVVASAVLLTIVAGMIIGRLLRLSLFGSVLAGCAVAICGASAALAVAAILPVYKDRERDTIFVVVTVTALSTLSMVFYPVAIQLVGFDDRQMGIFLGGTIHDVAQVVGAGYSISGDVGDIATVIKLFRVALLVPIVIILALLFSRHQGSGVKRSFSDIVPLFLIAFIVFVVINSGGYLPQPVTESLSLLSRWLLVAAIAALGIKTALDELSKVGIRPIILMLFCTAVIAFAVLGAEWFL